MLEDFSRRGLWVKRKMCPGFAGSEDSGYHEGAISRRVEHLGFWHTLAIRLCRKSVEILKFVISDLIGLAMGLGERRREKFRESGSRWKAIECIRTDGC
uniref:Uncharacterized protein n=1 Tax=Vespula pensylvanica TaxID=30213 RepID=A0A834P7K2_VESPE|nr:hypothetical protein H0235_004654 [Vespula pensylvanica]